MNDPDAIWKPGYDGPPPIVLAPLERADEHAADDIDRTEPDEPRSRGRRFGVVASVGVGAVVVLGLALVAAVVVLDPLDSGAVIERPDPSVFGGPAARRLPDGAAPLWSVDIEHDGEHWVDVVRRDLVVAAVAEPVTQPGTTVVALDALTGEQRWTLQLDGNPSDVTVVGAVDDVLVLEQQGVTGPTAAGVDMATGETRWSAVASDGHVGLIGTPFLARLSRPADRFVALIDAVSGREVGTIVSDSSATGRLHGWSTDRRGTWYLIDDGEVVEYDLRAELGEPTVVGSVDDVSAPRLVVDDRLVVIDDSGSITFEGSGTRGPVTVSDDVPDPVRSLTPAFDSNFVVTAPRSIAGVTVSGDRADLTWSRNDGELVAEHPVEGGTLLQVATRGGAGVQLVDGLTGETVEHLTLIPGALQALVVAGDGVVAMQASNFGAELAGLDLDGTERWSIAGAIPVIVGDRVVVRATSIDVIDDTPAASSRQLRITAYGDIE